MVFLVQFLTKTDNSIMFLVHLVSLLGKDG